MRVIYYALVKAKTIQMFLNVLLAEAVISENVQCTARNVKPIVDSDLVSIERKVLDRFVFGKKSNIKSKYVSELRGYYLSEGEKAGYFKKSFIFGFRKTKWFKSIVKNELLSFDTSIVNYLDTGDLRYLEGIVKDISLIQYPSFMSKKSYMIGIYKDRYAMTQAAVNHRFGHPN